MKNVSDTLGWRAREKVSTLNSMQLVSRANRIVSSTN